MNTNPINQSNQAFNVFLSAVKKEDLYSDLITRARVGQIYDKYRIVSQTLPLNEDQIVRGLITACARYTTMKIQDLTVLLVCGLDVITRIDLDIPAQDLAAKLANQNRDITDLDTANRILGQITTKLPFDLREKFTPEQRLGVVNLVFQLLGFKLGSDQKRMYETFKGSLVSASKYMTDEEKKSSLEDNYLDDLEQVLGKDTLAELKKQGYDPKDFSTEAVTMNINQGTYEEQLMALAPNAGKVPGQINTQPQPSPTATGTNSQPLPTTRITNQSGNEVLAAGYVDNAPELQMDIKNKDVYYFDKTSGSLVPLKDAEIIDGSTILSRRQLDRLFKEYNLSPGEIENLYANLTDDETVDNMRPGSDIPGTIYDDPELPFSTTTTMSSTDPISKDEGTMDESAAEIETTNKSGDTGLSKGAIAGIVIGVIVLLILIGLGVWWFRRSSRSPGSNAPSANNNRA
jgi:hypothetical protein